MTKDQVFPSNYLKASDIPEDSLLPAVIEKVEMKQIRQGEKAKPLIHFQNLDKALVCNVINWNSIVKSTGSDDSDNWTGKTIHLYRSETANPSGEMVECIRVRVKVKPIAKQKVQGAANSAPEWEEPYEEQNEQSIPF
jgi:hypothetical protein